MHDRSFLIASMLFMAGLSGCLSWGNGTNYFGAISAQQALYLADEALDLLASGEQLIFVGGRQQTGTGEPYDDFNGKLEEWHFGFYDPAEDHLREVVVDWGGDIHERSIPEWKGMRFNVHPINQTLGLDSPAALDSALDAINASVGTEGVKGVSYWLTNNGVTDVWRIILRPTDADPEVVQLNAATGAILTAGLPPIDFTYADAQDLINVTLEGILPPVGPIQPPIPPDEYIFAVAALETKNAGFGGIEALGHWAEDIIMPPDLDFGDGSAPVWAFFVWDSSTHETFVALAYADGIVVQGERHAASLIREAYEKRILFGQPMDSDQVFDPWETGDNVDQKYILLMQSVQKYLIWGLDFYDSRDMIVGWDFDGETGQRL